MRTEALITALSVLGGLLLGATGAHAFPSGVTYQGRILRPDGSVFSGSAAQFKLQLRTPDVGNCLMYEEVQTLDMRLSNGAFSLTINDGTGTRTDSTGLSLDTVFANHGTYTINPATCTSGPGTYTPASTDGRNLNVLFKDETMSTWEPIPTQRLNFVPFAFEAKQVAGYTSQSLVRVAEADGTLDLISPLSNASYTELLALIGGTTTQYAKSNGTGFTPTAAINFNSQRITNLATPTTGTDAANRTYVDSNLGGSSVNTAALTALAAGDSGKVLQWTGANWTAVASSASQWTSNGTAVYYNIGNVGIGTQTPTSKLSVTPSQYNTGTASQATTTVTGVGTTWTSAMVGSQLVFANGVTAGTITAVASAISLTVSISQTVASQAYNIAYSGLQVAANGNVGIGTTSPSALLTVSGTASAMKYQIGGADMLVSNTTNAWLAVGIGALSNQQGYGDVAIGQGAMAAELSSGFFNTAVGASASTKSTGFMITSLGFNALGNGLYQEKNTVIGAAAGQGDAAGFSSNGLTILGTSAGAALKSGSNYNTFVGTSSGGNVTTGLGNVFVGGYPFPYSGTNVTTGSYNIGLGFGISMPSATSSSQLNIGNVIFGTGLSGSLAAPAGNVGIGTAAPDAMLTVNGQMYSKLGSPSYAATTAIDFNTGNTQTITLAGATTFTFASGRGGAIYTVLVKQDATGSRALSWPATVKWPGGTAPTLTSTANAVDVFTFVSDGTNYFNLASALNVK